MLARAGCDVMCHQRLGLCGDLADWLRHLCLLALKALRKGLRLDLWSIFDVKWFQFGYFLNRLIPQTPETLFLELMERVSAY